MVKLISSIPVSNTSFEEYTPQFEDILKVESSIITVEEDTPHVGEYLINVE
jgi:hypothetical protein